MNKGSIVGPSWKLPFAGPFLQSVNPKFEEYYAKWLSGPLSCVSVFHKYVHLYFTLSCPANLDTMRPIITRPKLTNSYDQLADLLLLPRRVTWRARS